MRSLRKLCGPLLAACGWSLALNVAPALGGSGQAIPGGLEVVSNDSTQCVFGGMRSAVAIILRNRERTNIVIQLHFRLYQTTSATAAPFGEIPWKLLHVLAGQTVLEEFSLSLPAVRGETFFLLQCLDQTNRVIGAVPLAVYPAGLLEQLKPMLAGESLGVFDPQDTLKPLLADARVAMADLATNPMRAFSGRLAILAPRGDQLRDGEFMLADAMTLAKRGVGVVVLWPAPPPAGAIRPSFQIVSRLPGCVVVAQADLARDLASRPQSQLNLLQLCRAALNPALFGFPET